MVNPQLLVAQQALESLRPGFQSDGADLVVKAINGRTLVVDLVLTPETCMDCIVPNDMLAAIVEATVKTAMPQIDQVQVNDPRQVDDR